MEVSLRLLASTETLINGSFRVEVEDQSSPFGSMVMHVGMSQNGRVADSSWGPKNGYNASAFASFRAVVELFESQHFGFQLLLTVLQLLRDVERADPIDQLVELE
eukprot:s4093_g7.t1